MFKVFYYIRQQKGEIVVNFHPALQHWPIKNINLEEYLIYLRIFDKITLTTYIAVEMRTYENSLFIFWTRGPI